MDGGLFHGSPGMSEAAAVARAAGDTPSDEEVVRRVRAGEPELFEILMRRHNQRLYRVARSIVRNEAEHPDVRGAEPGAAGAHRRAAAAARGCGRRAPAHFALGVRAA